ncbi:hypothetical protein ALC60_03061, partial [Trachymyrmex zeteki]
LFDGPPPLFPFERPLPFVFPFAPGTPRWSSSDISVSETTPIITPRIGNTVASRWSSYVSETITVVPIRTRNTIASRWSSSDTSVSKTTLVPIHTGNTVARAPFDGPLPAPGPPKLVAPLFPLTSPLLLKFGAPYWVDRSVRPPFAPEVPVPGGRYELTGGSERTTANIAINVPLICDKNFINHKDVL